MYVIDELLLHAVAAERERQIAELRQAMRARRPAAALDRVPAPASRRLIRLLTELYDRGMPTADPARYDRLAWSGADGDEG